MPTVDASRAAFVSKAFRYEKAEDLTVKANYPASRELVIDTQLSAAAAATLATTMLNATKGVALEFEVEIDGAMALEDLEFAPPQYTVSFPQFATDSRTFRLVSVDADPLANVSKLRVRG